MIYPEALPPDGPPPKEGWVLCTKQAYETAMRQNLLHYSDQLTALKLEGELTKVRERVQELLSDLEDVRMLSKQAFVRCAACHRLKEVSKECRWCHR